MAHPDDSTANCTLSLRVTPNASRDELLGWDEAGSLRVKVRAVPEDGKANKAVITLLAKTLGIRKDQIKLLSGEKSRNKVLSIIGIEESAVLRYTYILNKAP